MNFFDVSIRADASSFSADCISGPESETIYLEHNPHPAAKFGLFLSPSSARQLARLLRVAAGVDEETQGAPQP